MESPRVVVMGLGYIGLPTAALIAGKGIRVVGVDVDPDVVSTINSGRVHIVEPDLEGLVRHVVSRKMLRATKVPREADVFIIAVPTPCTNNKKPDLTYVQKAFEMIAPVIQRGNLIVIESTCPVGTTERMKGFIYKKRPELKSKVMFAYCPERVLPGRILQELQYNDRVVGGIDPNSTMEAAAFYKRFVSGDILTTTAKTAELCKLVENSYRDVCIAYANELSLICAKCGVDVWEVIRLANHHPRVNILTPGPGVGGHCIAVDPWFLVHDFPREAVLIRTARCRNEAKREWVLNQILAECKSLMRQLKRPPVVACFGLAYKANTNDLRESPALKIALDLKERKGLLRVIAVEPNCQATRVCGIRNVSPERGVASADVIVVLVGHREFYTTDFGAKKMLDFCGVTQQCTPAR